MQINISNNQNSKYEITAKWICAFLMLFMIGIGITVYGASLSGIIVCILFFVLYVMMPGLTILKLMDINEIHTSTSFVSASFLGWTLCVALTYLCSLVGNDLLLIATGPILSIICLIDLIRSGQKESLLNTGKKLLHGVPLSFFIFLMIVMLFCLIGTQYQYLAPPKGEFAFISGDRAYHMGMSNAISHKLPLESLWIKGILIKYHIFTDILLSVPIRLFNVRTDTVGQLFAPVLTTVLVCSSLYAFFRETSNKPNRAGLYCLIFLLSSMFIARKWTSSLAFKFIFTNDNYAGFGLAAMLVFIIMFMKWYELYCKGENNHWRYFSVCLILIMLITGIKGPIAAVIIVGIWATFILGIILRKIPIKAIIPIVAVTICFVIIYVSVLGSAGQVNEAGGATLSFGEITEIAFWKDSLATFMKSHGIPKIIRLPVIMIVFTAFFFTVFLVPFIAGYVREVVLVLSEKKEFYPARVLVYASALIGFMAMLMLNYTGHNQVYFGLVTVILAPIISFWFIEDMENRSKESAFHERLLKLSIALMSIIMILTTFSLAGYIIRRGSESIGYAKQTIALSKYGGISGDEYRAMEWIRNNTDEESLLANDRYYSVPLEKYNPENRWNSSFFLYELYANRFSYISGSAYDLDREGSALRKERIKNNLKLYDPQNSERGKLARELGIDYVIVSKRFSGDINLENDDYEKCYSNDDVDIYRINK